MTNASLLPGILLLFSCRPVAAEPAQMVAFPAVETREAREAARRAAEEALVENIVLHRCTPDRGWCGELVRNGQSWLLEIVGRSGADGSERRIRFEPPDRDIGDPSFALWPHLVREADGAVTFGLLAARRTGFSGGGGLATRLILVRVEPGGPQAAEVLTVPVEGSAMIRACFSEEDMRQRREACHDEYEFAGTLTLAPDDGGGRPRFQFATRARTYPGDVTRWEDSADRPPLRRGDLVWADHPGCSYRRTFGFDPAARRYVADAPLPDCSQFLVGEIALAEGD
jgi:hypothetical protein